MDRPTDSYGVSCREGEVTVSSHFRHPGYTEKSEYAFTEGRELARYRDWVFRRNAQQPSLELGHLVDDLDNAVKWLPWEKDRGPVFDATWVERIPGTKSDLGLWQ